MVGRKIIALSISGRSLAVVAIPQPSIGESGTLDTRRAHATRTLPSAAAPAALTVRMPSWVVGFLAPRTPKALHRSEAHGGLHGAATGSIPVRPPKQNQPPRFEDFRGCPTDIE